jgi:vacuolar-type H+-ATPase subunit I/STV1
LAKQGKYDEAIYELSLVPNVSSTCYYQCLDTIASYYQKEIDADGRIMLKVAKAAWAASPNQDGAREVSQVIVNIDPMASCQKQVEELIQSIEEKLKFDQETEWKLKLKQYEDQVAMEKEKMRLAEEKSKRDASLQEQQSQRNLELDKIRIGAYQEIAVAYAKSLNQVNGYNNINWK